MPQAPFQLPRHLYTKGLNPKPYTQDTKVTTGQIPPPDPQTGVRRAFLHSYEADGGGCRQAEFSNLKAESSGRRV